MEEHKIAVSKHGAPGYCCLVIRRLRYSDLWHGPLGSVDLYCIGYEYANYASPIKQRVIIKRPLF